MLRFDGVRTTPWPSDVLLPSSQITTLLNGRDGTLWIGTSKGLASWKDGKLTSYAELAGHVINRMIEDRDGGAWVFGTTPPTGKIVHGQGSRRTVLGSRESVWLTGHHDV